ncbi:MAG: dTMP kinase [archaeon]
MKRGNYIAFDGCEGCGKTTQISLLEKYFLEKNIPYKLVREPGHTELGRTIRGLLLDFKEDIDPLTEMFLFEANRSDLFHRELIPALRNGQTVISDRSGYSTIAYQGFGGERDLELIKAMNRIATRGVRPDLTLILDILPEVGLNRKGKHDRFEEKDPEYHRRVREGYLWVAKNNPECVVVPYLEGVDKMQTILREIVGKKLDL